MSGDEGDGPDRRRFLSLVDCVLKSDLPLPARVVGRQGESTGAELDEAQVPEGSGSCDLVA
jgi:hypothetical protein